MTHLSKEILAGIRISILSCLLKKVLDSLPAGFRTPFLALGDSSAADLIERRVRGILDSPAVWLALPQTIKVDEGDFKGISEELERISCIVEGIGPFTSYTKEALREDLRRFLEHFSEVVRIIDEEPKADVILGEAAQY